MLAVEKVSNMMVQMNNRHKPIGSTSSSLLELSERYSLSRPLTTLCLVLVSASIAYCPSEAAEKKPPPKLYEIKIGDTFELLSAVPAGGTPDYVKELAKALKAGDKDGMATMLQDKKIELLPSGASIRVLEVTRSTYFEELTGRHKPPYAECRVTREGRTVGKRYVMVVFFADSSMKRVKQ